MGSGSEERKTRRGSRGGKNHRKKVAVASTDSEGEPDEMGGHGSESPTQVSDADDLEDVAIATAEPIVASRSDAPDPPSDEEEGYVPMSEWLDDFDRR